MYFEEFDTAEIYVTKGLKVTESMILDYAFQYDPQPFHLDPEHPQAQALGGLFASGYHGLSLSLRLLVDHGLLAQNIIGLALDNVRWHAPIKADAIIYTENRAILLRPSASKPDRGIVTIETKMYARMCDSQDVLLMTAEVTCQIKKRS